MWDKIYPSNTLKIYTSNELNRFGKRYHEIMVKTRQGTTPENRTEEQTDLVNKCVTSMLPILDWMAFSLINTGYCKLKHIPFAFTLGRISVNAIQRIISQIDVIHEGAVYVAEKFQNYDPHKSKIGTGSVHSFIIYWAGERMAEYILQSIPNHRGISRKIKERRELGLSEREIYEDLPYFRGVSLTDILYKDEEGAKNVALERKFLTSDEDPERDFISGERHATVAKLLSTLTEHEREILERRRGLNGYEVITLKKLGEEYGISGEGVRQIEMKALDKLRKRAPKGAVELLR